MSVLYCVTFHLWCWLINYTVAGTALRPTLTVGMPAIGPGVFQALFSPDYQHRSTEVRSQDCSNCAPGPAVGAMEAAQILARSSPHVYVHTNPQLLKLDPSQLG